MKSEGVDWGRAMLQGCPELRYPTMLKRQGRG